VCGGVEIADVSLLELKAVDDKGSGFSVLGGLVFSFSLVASQLRISGLGILKDEDGAGACRATIRSR